MVIPTLSTGRARVPVASTWSIRGRHRPEESGGPSSLPAVRERTALNERARGPPRDGHSIPSRSAASRAASRHGLDEVDAKARVEHDQPSRWTGGCSRSAVRTARRRSSRRYVVDIDTPSPESSLVSRGLVAVGPAVAANRWSVVAALDDSKDEECARRLISGRVPLRVGLVQQRELWRQGSLDVAEGDP